MVWYYCLLYCDSLLDYSIEGCYGDHDFLPLLLLFLQIDTLSPEKLDESSAQSRVEAVNHATKSAAKNTSIKAMWKKFAKKATKKKSSVDDVSSVNFKY